MAGFAARGIIHNSIVPYPASLFEPNRPCTNHFEPARISLAFVLCETVSAGCRTCPNPPKPQSRREKKPSRLTVMIFGTVISVQAHQFWPENYGKLDGKRPREHNNLIWCFLRAEIAPLENVPALNWNVETHSAFWGKSGSQTRISGQFTQPVKPVIFHFVIWAEKIMGLIRPRKVGCRGIYAPEDDSNTFLIDQSKNGPIYRTLRGFLINSATVPGVGTPVPQSSINLLWFCWI